VLRRDIWIRGNRNFSIAKQDRETRSWGRKIRETGVGQTHHLVGREEVWLVGKVQVSRPSVSRMVRTKFLLLMSSTSLW
jgi:hypothetical protein